MSLDILSVLTAYCRNYRIIAKEGFAFKKPVALVFEDIADAAKVISRIDPMATVNYSASKVEDFQEAILMCESPGFFWRYPQTTGYRTVKSLEQLEILLQATNFGKLGNDSVDAAIFMIFDNLIPAELGGKVYEVYIEKNPDFCEPFSWIVPEPEEVPIILHSLSSRDISGLTPLLCASEFIYLPCIETGRIEVYETVVSAVKHLDEENEEYYEIESIVDSVVACFKRAGKEGKLSVVNLSSLDVDTIDIEKCVYFYKEHIYISDDLFKNVVKTIIKGHRIGQLKLDLLSADILCGRSGQYTTKLRFRIDGKEYPKRMLKFKLENAPELASLQYK